MKDKIIETAGKTWKLLGQYGETSVSQLPQLINEQDNVVYQALGWLAREDKINYTIKSRKAFVSLVESELQAFKNLSHGGNGGGLETPLIKKQAKNRLAKVS